MRLLQAAALAAAGAAGSAPVAANGSAARVVRVLDDFESVSEFRTDAGGIFNFPFRFGTIDLSTSPDAVAGAHSAKLEYDFGQVGPFFSYVLVIHMKEGEAWDCTGATHVSLRYKVLEPQSRPGVAHVRVTLLDTSECDGPQCDDYYGFATENHFSFHFDVLDDASGAWRELRVELCGDGFSPAPPI